MMTQLVTTALALLAGTTLHLVLRRAQQRLTGLAKRQRRRGRDVRPLRLVALAALVGQWAVWLGVLGMLTRLVPPLMTLRTQLQELLHTALVSPLFDFSGRQVTASDLFIFPLVGAAIWLFAQSATHLLRASFLRGVGLEGATEQTVASLLQYCLLFAGTLIALTTAGVDLRGFAIFGGVLGVGIGFGLQNIANNFVSGLVIGFERPIRPGDFIKIGEHVGTVMRVGARSTTVVTLDRVSILVPNSRFLEHEVVNWSLNDPVTRVHVPVGLQYGSNVATVRAALRTVARAHPAVLREPRPQVQFREFGRSALEFELIVWSRDPKNQFTLVSDLNYLIEDELARRGLTVPFDQLDLHVRSSDIETGAASASSEPKDEHEPDASVEAALKEPVPKAPSNRASRSSVLQSVVREDRGPEGWTVAEVEEAAIRMGGPEGVTVQDRRYILRVFPKCFLGNEAVSWLVENTRLTRAEALSLGQRMLELGFLRHVLDEHGFQDGHYFYTFPEQDRE